MKKLLESIFYLLCFYLPITDGSKSTNTALGTCFPAPVSLKKVLKESSPPPMVLSVGIWPFGWIPCSRQYSSQQALPIWTPAWPMWIEMHSRWMKKNVHFSLFQSKPINTSKQQRKKTKQITIWPKRLRQKQSLLMYYYFSFLSYNYCYQVKRTKRRIKHVCTYMYIQLCTYIAQWWYRL